MSQLCWDLDKLSSSPLGAGFIRVRLVSCALGSLRYSSYWAFFDRYQELKGLALMFAPRFLMNGKRAGGLPPRRPLESLGIVKGVGTHNMQKSFLAVS